MNLSDIKQLFTYTEWANDLAMDAAARLPEESLRRDVGISHKSIFGTLVHMAGAEWIWVERWHGRSPTKAEAWSRWSIESCGDLNTLKECWTEVVSHRTQFVSELDESRLAAELPFELLSGDPSSMPLINQMQHVVNHATLHRGRVVGMTRQLGIEPPATDLIFYLRRDISPK
ncbi:MAG TPA: DinB family protein [Pyrinomonadaceae bacterium]|nr:DinB family protein [Pyrinomonadaceae bacterium]